MNVARDSATSDDIAKLIERPEEEYKPGTILTGRIVGRAGDDVVEQLTLEPFLEDPVTRGEAELALLAVARADFAHAALLMLVALAIDSVDGTLARAFRVAEVLPQARIIHLLRDPREMLVSLSKVIPQPELSDTGLPEQAQVFESLSDLLWESLAAFGTGTAEPVRRFHCPMAFDDRGAFWIQKGETTANPYYGAMMLRCGSQKDVLEGSATAGRASASWSTLRTPCVSSSTSSAPAAWGR